MNQSHQSFLDSKLKFHADFTEDEIQKAFTYWSILTDPERSDRVLNQLMELTNPDVDSWLRFAREKSFLSQEEVARKLDFSRNTLSKLERSEDSGTISINSLKKVAAAMDCELVYFLRPINKKPYSFKIWQKLIKVCEKAPRFRNIKSGKRALPLANLAFETLKSLEFREKNNLKNRWDQPEANS